MIFQRKVTLDLIQALESDPKHLQILIGPRQVGKTTGVLQAIDELKWPNVFASADEPFPPGPDWIETQWRLARLEAKKNPDRRVILVLDEIQKIQGWSEVVKRLWDEELRIRGNIAPVLLGSSSLLLQKGLSESLAGRFFLHRYTYWTYPECKKAFCWDLNNWLYFGGYPGAAPFSNDEQLWKRFVADSLIETVLSRDVVQLQAITKPALLRHLFGLAATYPAQIFSYNKMLGQLTDAGNTTTLSHYLKLLETGYLVSGLESFSKGQIRKRGSSPKLILWNNALINSLSRFSKDEAVGDPVLWGRIVENAVGAHFLNGITQPDQTLTYWRRDGKFEVDFVMVFGNEICAIEVKSGLPGKLQGLHDFKKLYPSAKSLIIGGGGLPLEEFFSRPALEWL